MAVVSLVETPRRMQSNTRTRAQPRQPVLHAPMQSRRHSERRPQMYVARQCVVPLAARVRVIAILVLFRCFLTRLCCHRIRCFCPFAAPLQGLVAETERLRSQVSMLSPTRSGTSGGGGAFNDALPSPVNPSTIRFLQTQSSFKSPADAAGDSVDFV